MTTRRTAASVVGLLIFYRELPISERHGCRDLFWVCTCVNDMTRAAGPSMRCLVDVDEMHIAIAVTELRSAGGVLFRRQRRIVTAETKIVIGCEKGSIETLRILLSR